MHGAANLNTLGAVQMRLPDDQIMASHVAGLAYFDTSTGQSVLIAAIKDSTGILVSQNELVYPDAFAELAADVRYTYTRAGFEQDIILRQQPPAPTEYGLNPETTRLEVWTEFERAPQPARKGGKVAVAAGVEPDESELNFGAARIGSGRAFRLGKEDESLALVVKHWITDDSNRKFLVEAIDMTSVAEGLNQLPKTQGGASTQAPKRTRLQVLNSQPVKQRRAGLEGLQVRRLDPYRDQMIVATLARPGLVVDYLTLNTSQSNYTFTSDETYYITGSVILTGTTTLEGGTVIKMDSSTSAQIRVDGALNFGGAPYRPVIITAKDDNTIGEAIPGSSGNPTTTYYGSASGALALNNGSAATLTHFRVSHQRRGLEFSSGTGHIVRHGQIVRCQEGVDPLNTVNLHNILFNNTEKVLAGTAATVFGQHLTVNTATHFNFNSTATVTLNNCVLVAVTTPGTYSNPNSSVTTAANGTGLFEAVGGGNHYLLTGSSAKNSGTISIDSTLATEIKSMTTDSPVIITGTLNSLTALAPRATLDINTPDRGYHYVPLDYVLKTVNLSSTLVLTNSVAVAFAGTYGVDLLSGSRFLSEGRAEKFNRITRWHNVQEQSAAEGNGGPMTRITTDYGSGRPVLSVRFSEISACSKSGTRLLDNSNIRSFNSITIEFSTSRNVGLESLYPVDTSAETVVIRNNIFERVKTSVNKSSFYSADTQLAVDVSNNLFWRGSLEMTYDTGTVNPTWLIRDNLFDGTTQTLNGTAWSTGVSRLHNGFINGTATTYNGSSGKTGLNTDYQANGVWGSRYYPVSGAAPSLATLIDAGSPTVSGGEL